MGKYLNIRSQRQRTIESQESMLRVMSAGLDSVLCDGTLLQPYDPQLQTIIRDASSIATEISFLVDELHDNTRKEGAKL